MKTVGPAYFETGVFTRTRRGELFAWYTCVLCDTRSLTWGLFRQHRAHCAARWAAPPESLALPG